jgi:nucleoside-diphosphate-sugar epimerase
MVRLLQQAGHDVAGLDTSYFAACGFADGERSISALTKDIRDITADDLRGFDAVVHLAGLSNDPMGDLNPSLTLEINFHASVRLAAAAKAAGVQRYLFSSSCSVYGCSGDVDATEDCPLMPLTPYAISKVRTEEVVSTMADDRFSPVFLRNATAYGVSPRLRLDLVLNNLVGWAVTTGKIRIQSDGTPWRPLVHIEDIARAFVGVLTASREAVHNQAFNVGTDSENYQVRDLAHIVGEVVPNSTVEILGESAGDRRDYRVDFSKLARHVPSFTPQWTARKGASELYAAFCSFGLGKEELESGRRYVRLRELRHLLESGALTETLRWNRQGISRSASTAAEEKCLA